MQRLWRRISEFVGNRGAVANVEGQRAAWARDHAAVDRLEDRLFALRRRPEPQAA